MALPLVISPLLSVCEEVSLSSSTSALDSTLGLWLCSAAPQRNRPEGFPSNQGLGQPLPQGLLDQVSKATDPFPEGNLQKANTQSRADPSGLSHVGQAGPAWPPFHPLPQPCQTVANLTNPAQPFSHRRGKSRRERLTHISPGSRRQHPGGLVSFLSSECTIRATWEP